MTEPNDAPGDEGARATAWRSQNRWNHRNPAARQAHAKVRTARKTGTLSPKTCEWPGCDAKHVEAHHARYDRPLEVKWFCRLHHKAEHKRLRCDALGDAARG